MTEKIICAGFGGQGIMLLGKFIAYGAMKKGLHTTWMPSYGAEVRGGTAHSMVVISDDEVSSPLISLCDIAIIMNSLSFKKFIPKIRQKGLLILNSSLIDDETGRDDLIVCKVPMTELALSLGNVRVANMIALGAFMSKRPIFSKDDIIEGINIAFEGNNKLVELNKKALEQGLNIK